MSIILPFCLLAALAAILEACIGYPQFIYRMIGHPVTWMGLFLNALEKRFNKPSFSFLQRKRFGIIVLVLYLSVSALIVYILAYLCLQFSFGWVFFVILGSTFLAQRSLYVHVAAVAYALKHQGIEQARHAVSMIVGRKTDNLDEAAILRAAIESLSENFSDGIVAPLFWLAIAGLPGGAVYKAVNTADSMIGHRNEKFEAFGWAAARFDDLVNLPCSRLAALWLTLAAYLLPHAEGTKAIKTIRKDAHRHRSPNAGWPEAAMAGALGLKLGGLRMYGTEEADVATMGDGNYDLTSHDIQRALQLYLVACGLQIIFLLIVSLIYFL